MFHILYISTSTSDLAMDLVHVRIICIVEKARICGGNGAVV